MLLIKFLVFFLRRSHALNFRSTKEEKQPVLLTDCFVPFSFLFFVFRFLFEMDVEPEPGPSTRSEEVEMEVEDEDEEGEEEEVDDVEEEDASGESENEESDSGSSDSEDDVPNRAEDGGGETPEGIADELVSQAPLKFLNGQSKL
jgi:hypothetical protein